MHNAELPASYTSIERQQLHHIMQAVGNGGLAWPYALQAQGAASSKHSSKAHAIPVSIGPMSGRNVMESTLLPPIRDHGGQHLCFGQHNVPYIYFTFYRSFHDVLKASIMP